MDEGEEGDVEGKAKVKTEEDVALFLRAKKPFCCDAGVMCWGPNDSFSVEFSLVFLLETLCSRSYHTWFVLCVVFFSCCLVSLLLGQRAGGGRSSCCVCVCFGAWEKMKKTGKKVAGLVLFLRSSCEISGELIRVDQSSSLPIRFRARGPPKNGPFASCCSLWSLLASWRKGSRATGHVLDRG